MTNIYLEKIAFLGTLARSLMPKAPAVPKSPLVRKGAITSVRSAPYGTAGASKMKPAYDWSNELRSSGGHRIMKTASANKYVCKLSDMGLI